MATLKTPKIGTYGPKTRDLQKRLSYEKVSLTWKTAVVHKYLGDASEISPDITDLGDPILMEITDRAYDPTTIDINVWYDILPEQLMDLSRFGIINPIGNTQQFRFHSYSFENDGLGRYIIPGDVFEIPFLLQNGRKAYWEVTDVDRSQEFENYYIIVTATPLMDSQETEEIPDMPSDQVQLDGLMVSIDAAQDAAFTTGQTDDSDLVVDEANAQDPYDPRPDAGSDFLDDPTSTPFG